MQTVSNARDSRHPSKGHRRHGKHRASQSSRYKDRITRMRGQFHEYFGVKVMPTFHPAYLLRDPSKKREVWTI